ncbi:MAG: glyoxalase [Gammaproteobacteria bacterium RIFCSPLOWO2_02_FULL_42_14]|nr:MAG: glyoxalase [Gammaproteobacteria bacterium RIFCSPHIGHO2_02_FULL_42_43]OGT29078.1 MAG: glyoxalase [Gammaproteobacteria bacterium RIFCSPHIGHO2_01_FULL_42_8]OGT52739.1 MAG: glyoxalase [Gammaproteobacteria bacterium RIFCSPHIGHO2_12_FULL_41_25]OGT63299.1 MAG: glyoxalase [Gammaproteobacteria bacterium RIFCSPLOWO2_02_FULL_42_14]OGT86887.1 MAG: glyoxalase [Gammaproteobacteria bacterium RIFCSPLOWO2_12_FULL_42_18]
MKILLKAGGAVKTLGLRHVALNVFEIDACISFYTAIFNMKIEWQPDSDNVYLTSGNDNFALHRVARVERQRESQRLDHIGFFVESPQAVDEWFIFLKSKHVDIVKEPKTHRDGARSLYCKDPDGNVVQVIYHPPIK